MVTPRPVELRGRRTWVSRCVAFLRWALDRAKTAVVLLILSVLTFAFWWYIRLFACWGEMNTLPGIFFCKYDLLLLALALFLAAAAIYRATLIVLPRRRFVLRLLATGIVLWIGYLFFFSSVSFGLLL